jgi:PAS domain S-box-containing protein
MNKGAQRIKGYSPEEIVGRSFTTFINEEDRAAGLPQQLLRSAADNGSVSHEGWRLRKDGSRFWGNVVNTALHDDSGAIIGFAKVTRDLTERKSGEDILSNYANELVFKNAELKAK